MSKSVSTSAALIAMTERVVKLQDELADMQGAYEKARNRAAQSKLSLYAMQKGMNRKNVQLDSLKAYMESHQQISIYRAEQKEARQRAAIEWFKTHPEDKPEGWDEKHS
ncbi:MAG: hypothetical protein IIB77_10160 [Proteobacteria bacterium]|nr:hypothetical protein [Pseudomonadota bacterium]